MKGKRERFTPRQRLVLWLMNEHARVVFRAGVRATMWTIEEDGTVTISGCFPIREALLNRTLIEATGDCYRLTSAGATVVRNLKRVPVLLDQTKCPESLTMLSEEQIQSVSGWFPVIRGGNPRQNDQLVLSGIVHVLRHNLLWGAAPRIYGTERQLHSRFVRWGALGVLDHVFANLTERKHDRLQLVVDDAMLARNGTSRMGALRGWFPTLLPAEEIAA